MEKINNEYYKMEKRKSVFMCEKCMLYYMDGEEHACYTPPNHLSPSQLNLYLKNQKEYYNRYILEIDDNEDKLSYAIGREFENYLFNQNVDWASLSTSKLAKIKNPKDEKDIKAREKLAIECKERYESTFISMKELVMAQELILNHSSVDVTTELEIEYQKEMRHLFSNTEILGYIDYMDRNKIIELKTFGNEYQFKQLLDKYKRQLLTYSMAFPNKKCYLVAVEVSEYPTIKVYELSKETIERETPILIEMYRDLQRAKELNLFDIEPKQVEIEKL